MKRTRFLIAAAVVLTLSSCIIGQPGKSVSGNHKVTKTERSVNPFTGVKASSGVDVYVSQGDNQSVTVEADENLHEHILTEVRGDVLHVYTDINIRDAEKERVYVTMKDVKSLETTSAADIIGETPIKTGKLELSANSAGDIKLEVFADELRVDISSSGDISLKGETGKLNADLSSAGDLKAYDLKAREADVSVSSAGDADINVSEKLTAVASSAGSVHYTGNPSYVDAHSSSAGGIHKR